MPKNDINPLPKSANLYNGISKEKHPFNNTEAKSSFVNTKLNNTDFAYNGLGGHSKEEKYPMPNGSSSMGKRSRSSSTLSSTKFRKLAPTKKMSDFFKSQYDT